MGRVEVDGRTVDRSGPRTASRDNGCLTKTRATSGGAALTTQPSGSAGHSVPQFVLHSIVLTWRTAAAALALAGVSSVATAQENPAVSLARIKVALESPSVTTLIPPAPDVKSWGPFSLVPPDTAGEMVKIRVAVGELAMKAAHTIAAASHERAERKAREEVARELQDFLPHHPK